LKGCEGQKERISVEKRGKRGWGGGEVELASGGGGVGIGEKVLTVGEGKRKKGWGVGRGCYGMGPVNLSGTPGGKRISKNS